MNVTIFFFIVAYFAGRAIIKLVKLNLEDIIHPASMVLGLVFLCLLFYLEGFLFKSFETLRSLITLIGLIVIALMVLGKEVKRFLRRRSFDSLRSLRMTLRQAQGKLSAIIIPFVFIIFVIWFFGRSLFIGASGEIIAGDRLVWTDWPLHIGMASNFAFGANFPAQNPHFAGIPLNYPFMADFLSGILLSLGVSLPLAFVIPGIVLTLSFFWIFVGWGKEIIGKNKIPAFAGMTIKKVGMMEKKAKMTKMPYLTLIISLFWGGLGWVYWLKDVFASEVTFIETLLNPPREYTFWSEKGLWFFTFLYSEILPQRAFLFGLPMFFLILWLVKKGWDNKQNKYLFIAGILGGLLPFFHTHSFISLWMLSGAGFVAVIFKMFKSDKPLQKILIKNLFSFFLPLSILSLIQLPFFSSNISLPFVFGWMKGKENFFWFWFKNTGLFIPLWFLGFWKGKFSKFVKVLGVSSWLMFILPNLFQFAPWGYDNLKIITYWYVIGSVFVITGLKWIWEIKLIRPIGKIFAILLFFSLTLSGFLEISRLIHTDKTQITLWSKQDQELAEIIKEKTPVQAVFLTAAIHDHPIETLAGRKIVLGYPGNSWSWGISGWDTRERDVHTMFQGGEQAKLLWKKYQINYIIVSDREKWFEPKLDEEFIKQNSELVLEKDGAKLFKVK